MESLQSRRDICSHRRKACGTQAEETEVCEADGINLCRLFHRLDGLTQRFPQLTLWAKNMPLASQAVENGMEGYNKIGKFN